MLSFAPAAAPAAAAVYCWAAKLRLNAARRQDEFERTAAEITEWLNEDELSPLPDLVLDTFWFDVMGIPLDDWCAAGECHGLDGFTFTTVAMDDLRRRRESGEWDVPPEPFVPEEPPERDEIRSYAELHAILVALDAKRTDEPVRREAESCHHCGSHLMTTIHVFDPDDGRLLGSTPTCHLCRQEYLEAERERG